MDKKKHTGGVQNRRISKVKFGKGQLLRLKYPGNSFYHPNITRKIYVCSKCFEYFEKETNCNKHLEEDCYQTMMLVSLNF